MKTWMAAGCVALAVSAAAADETVLQQGAWSKKNHAIEGTWKIVRSGDRIDVVLDEAFRTKKAPDLKIVLSPRPLAEATDKNAMDGAFLVSLLESHKGAQRYAISAGTDQSKFKSILIHCEKYSLLWGGADLAVRP